MVETNARGLELDINAPTLVAIHYGILASCGASSEHDEHLLDRDMATEYGARSTNRKTTLDGKEKIDTPVNLRMVRTWRNVNCFDYKRRQDRDMVNKYGAWSTECNTTFDRNAIDSELE